MPKFFLHSIFFTLHSSVLYFCRHYADDLQMNTYRILSVYNQNKELNG